MLAYWQIMLFGSLSLSAHGDWHRWPSCRVWCVSYGNRITPISTFSCHGINLDYFLLRPTWKKVCRNILFSQCYNILGKPCKKRHLEIIWVLLCGTCLIHFQILFPLRIFTATKKSHRNNLYPIDCITYNDCMLLLVSSKAQSTKSSAMSETLLQAMLRINL